MCACVGVGWGGGGVCSCVTDPCRAGAAGGGLVGGAGGGWREGRSFVLLDEVGCPQNACIFIPSKC